MTALTTSGHSFSTSIRRFFLFLLASTRAQQGAGEDREAAPDAVPHAHKPGAARVRLPGVGDAHRDPLHGRPRVRRPAPHDLQDVLPAAEELGAAESGGTAGEHEGARGGRRQGHAQRPLGHLQRVHHQ